MKKALRIITLLLVLAMTLGVFASCKKDGEDDGDGSSNGGDHVYTSADDGSEEALYCPEQKNYGYTYKILTETNGNADLPYYVYAEDKPSGEVISNALFVRKALMKDYYGVTLEVIEDKEYKETLVTAGSAGDYVCDVTMIPAYETFSLATQGYYCNLLNLSDSLHLDASYWDQRIQKEYRINDMLFTLDGDFTYMDELRTLVVLYNETLYKDYGYTTKYGTPYSMVENHTWTYETMMEMIADLSEDLDGNLQMNEDDQYGMVSELTATYYFFLGAGLKTLTNNNGELTLQLTDSTQYARIYDVIEKTMKLAENKDVLMANGGQITSSSFWTAASDVFETDRALFRTTTLSAVTRLGDMKSNYGILPIPAFYEDQTEYYCWCSGNTDTPLAISNCVPDVTVTAEITEILCYHSRYGNDTLYSAFFDQMAYSRICRSADDINMLTLIINSKTYDIDQVAKITGVEGSMYDLAKAKNFTAISSTLSGLVETSKSKLDKYLITLLANCS